MGAVMHLFGEDVGRVDFTGNVPDYNFLVLDPFANRIFAKLNDMTCCLRSHVVTPPDTVVIVVVEDSWLIYISNPKTRLRKAKTEVA